MIAGSAFVVYDTLLRTHQHQHSHTFTHTHDGSTHTHTVVHTHLHTHLHKHFVTDEKHGHHHSMEELEKAAEHI